MKCLEINNFVNEDDVVNRKSCPKANNSPMDRKMLESDRKELLATLVLMLTTNSDSAAVNNRLTSKTEIMNLINTLRSSQFKREFDARRDSQWKTPLIEDFLPSEDSQDSTDSELNWNNSELNYYNKEIENL